MEVYLTMKKLLAILMALMAINLVMTGCKKDEAAEGGDAAATTGGTTGETK